MGHSIGVAHDPSVADYRATSPRWRAGRNMIGSCSQARDGNYFHGSATLGQNGVLRLV